MDHNSEKQIFIKDADVYEQKVKSSLGTLPWFKFKTPLSLHPSTWIHTDACKPDPHYMSLPILTAEYRPKLLLTTRYSMLWSIRAYDLNYKLKDFDDIPLIHNPELFNYDRICHAQRSVRSFSLDELMSPHHLHESTVEGNRIPLLSDLDTPSTSSFLENNNEDTVGDVPVAALKMLLNILIRVKTLLNFDFDRLLINRYENGTDYIGSHSDKEVYPGDPVISICYGATRTFRIRDRITKAIVLDVPHQNGTLLVMAGNFQHEFKHEIPVQKRVQGARVSVTLRRRYGDESD